ncbi:Gfo/Idh/MocA family oxidoreductase [Candidatus Woesearchaeota archaeon]|nr:Gfo/Idh/MocA family oxidoreductase [Candidatus Woesearchaeota archaeon]
MIKRFFRRFSVPSPTQKGIPSVLVGLGGYAENVIIPTLLKTQQYNLRAVCSNDQKRITSIRRMYRIPEGSASLQNYLQRDDISLVFITQKDNLHARTVVEVANAKKDIFVEKPLALTSGECTSIVKAVTKNNVRLTVGLNRRFSPLGQALKEKLRTRVSPVLLLYRFNQERQVSNRKEWVLQESSPVQNLFGHIIDFTSWVLDDVPVRVYAQSSSPSPHRDVVATVTFSDGSLLTIAFTMSDNKLGRETIEIYDEGRTIALREFQELRFYGHPDRDITLSSPDKGQYNQLDSFARFLHGDQSAPLVTLQDGINAALFSCSVLESITKKCAVPLTWKKS